MANFDSLAVNFGLYTLKPWSSIICYNMFRLKRKNNNEGLLTFVKENLLESKAYISQRIFSFCSSSLWDERITDSSICPNLPSLIAIFRPFLANFLPSTQISFTKLRFRLRCWTGLILNWLKSYDTKCKYIFPDLANSWNDKWPFFPTISSRFFAIYIIIFHKTEIQMVIGSKVMTQNANGAVITRRRSFHLFYFSLFEHFRCQLIICAPNSSNLPFQDEQFWCPFCRSWGSLHQCRACFDLHSIALQWTVWLYRPEMIRIKNGKWYETYQYKQ
jgi:hypothetical protein